MCVLRRGALVIGQFAAASISNIPRNAGRIFEGMSLKMSSAMPAHDPLLVCHRIADADPI
jgi:hypothetical protein